MKDFLYLKARAKINTALDVIGKRPDGYHDLRMIMQTLNLCDILFIKKTYGNDIILRTSASFLPNDERNLVYKAAKILKERYSITDGIFIELQKNIPVAAGLAGGSSDCAATLIGIRNLFKLPITNDELMSIGKELGADVPYCIMRGTALAEGIGEKLTPLSPFPKTFVVLAKPPINVSTPTVFKSFDLNNVTKRPDIEKMIAAIKNNDINAVCSGLCNVLETVTIKNYPIIKDIKESMLNNNALGSLMSGSGPTVFGFFKTYEDSVKALEAIKDKFKIKEVYITTIFNR